MKPTPHKGDYIRVNYGGKLHLVTGLTAKLKLPHTACGRWSFNYEPIALEVFEDADERDICMGCKRSRDHHLNVGTGEPQGGMPVGSAGIGTGSRWY